MMLSKLAANAQKLKRKQKLERKETELWAEKEKLKLESQMTDFKKIWELWAHKYKSKAKDLHFATT